MFDQGLRVKQDEAEATTEFLFVIYDCTVHSDVGTGNFSLMLGILLICGHTYIGSQVPLGHELALHLGGWCCIGIGLSTLCRFPVTPLGYSLH